MSTKCDLFDKSPLRVYYDSVELPEGASPTTKGLWLSSRWSDEDVFLTADELRFLLSDEARETILRELRHA